MATDPAYFKGCLLGMAVGDAMGVTVDGKRYSQICEAYGPAGLLGYDLANGCAEISSYTQVAAFACNGMLLSIARGQTGVDACVRYVTQALKEWARAQHLPGAPERRSGSAPSSARSSSPSSSFTAMRSAWKTRVAG